ncbi:hypothetical protein [Legionella genomosp. 1]|uniref:hypothetical protein n=1 Tax=Legionella genomosp. 1 TaxID=1093625 RepID=UPI0010558FE8|nr:hypothetical protein [Legionella genomosp. 1]
MRIDELLLASRQASIPIHFPYETVEKTFREHGVVLTKADYESFTSLLAITYQAVLTETPYYTAKERSESAYENAIKLTIAFETEKKRFNI